MSNATLTPGIGTRSKASRISLGATVSQLRTNLTPSNLIDEVAGASGLREATPKGVFDYGVRSSPVPTALIGLGIGLFPLVRSKSARGSAKGFVSETVRSLERSATNVFHERAEAKMASLFGAANSHIKAGASHFSYMVEKSVVI